MQTAGALFNHGGPSANVAFWPTESGGMRFTTTADVSAGAELLDSYGSREPFEWLSVYEFLPAEMLQAAQACPSLLSPSPHSSHKSSRERESSQHNPCSRPLQALVRECELSDLRCMHAYAMHRDTKAWSELATMLHGAGDVGGAREAFEQITRYHFE